MIDMGTSIFLAVLWFSAFGDILHLMIPCADAAVIGVLVLQLYVVAMFVAYNLRENKFSLFVVLGISAHFIAFAAIKAATEAQQSSGRLGGAAVSFGFCIMLFGIFAAISIVCFYPWRRYSKSWSWEENTKSQDNINFHAAIDELELDVAGLVLSFTIMQALRHALSGHYPTPAHFFLQSSSSLAPSALRTIAGGHGHATEKQKAEMLMWSIGFTVLACVALFILNAVKDKMHYWCHKLLHIVEVVLVMCAAWGYLLWGAWQFTETDFAGDPMFGNMIFAVMVTVVSFVVIIVAGFAIDRKLLVKGYARLCIMAISLVTAWSWEHCFHVAVNIVALEYQQGYGGLIPKIIIAVIVPLATLPGYIAFLKPIVLEKTERFDADEEEEEHNDLDEVLYEDPMQLRELEWQQPEPSFRQKQPELSSARRAEPPGFEWKRSSGAEVGCYSGSCMGPLSGFMK